MLKGYKTILVGLLLAVGTPALDYLAGINWTDQVGSTGAVIISGVLMVAMRFLTSTPALKG